MVLRYWPAAAILVVAIGAVFFCLFSSPDFRHCINHEGQHASPQKDEKGAPSIRAASKGDIDILFACTGDFSNDNANAITALATFFLTLVTGGLVLIGYQQIRTSRAQLRAYIFVEFANIFDGPTWPNSPTPAASGAPNSFLHIKNYGQTPAFNVRHWSEITIIPFGGDEDALVIPKDISFLNANAIGGDYLADAPNTFRGIFPSGRTGRWQQIGGSGIGSHS